MKIQEHVPLASFTTFEVGGEARFFVEAHTVEDVLSALDFAKANSLSLFVLGGGSNILIADSGFDGLVLLMRIESIIESQDGNRTLVTVGAGVVWDDFVSWSIEKKLVGLECLSGVPGTIGGAVVANLGAYGAQCSDTFVRAEVVNLQEQNIGIKMYKKEKCDFSYHDSYFAHASGRYVILSATFALSNDSAAQPSYRDNRFDMTTLTKKLGRTPTQQEIREAVLMMREEKGSLIMKDRFSFKCAGSFFHMPFVPAEQYEKVVVRARELDVEKEERLRPWAWKQVDGSYKLAPGFLLEYSEFQKGYSRDTVGVSPKHTLSIINIEDASAKDIAGLAHDMQIAVKNIFGVHLEREVEYVGKVENEA